MIDKDTYIAAIDEYINGDKKPSVIEYTDNGNTKFVVNVKENIDYDDVYTAIVTIVDQVVNKDFEYSVIDIIMPYYLISLFTDIPTPLTSDNEPDYQKCFDIVIGLDLEENLCAFPIVANYISIIEKNVWRKLEYYKALKSIMPFDGLISALGEFYEILDDLNDVVESQKNIDFDDILNESKNLNEQLSKLNSLKEDFNKSEENK